MEHHHWNGGKLNSYDKMEEEQDIDKEAFNKGQNRQEELSMYHLVNSESLLYLMVN